MTLRRLSSDGDSWTVESYFETTDQFRLNIEQLYKADIPRPSEVSGFYGTFLQTGTDRISSVDGGIRLRFCYKRGRCYTLHGEYQRANY